MTHQMKLNNQPFLQIANGSKSIEVRLYDDKRRRVNVGDEIIFQHVQDASMVISTRVVALHRYDTFGELYSAFDYAKFGCQGWSECDMINGTYDIYTREQERQYGVLGIEIELISNH